MHEAFKTTQEVESTQYQLLYNRDTNEYAVQEWEIDDANPDNKKMKMLGEIGVNSSVGTFEQSGPMYKSKEELESAIEVLIKKGVKVTAEENRGGRVSYSDQKNKFGLP